MGRSAPAPGEVHPAYPAYADMPWLSDWVNKGDHPYGEHMVMPILRPIRLSPEDVYPRAPDMGRRILTRRKAWGAAPYVGDPFVYMWRFAEDELGRVVAGESWIQPLPQGAW